MIDSSSRIRAIIIFALVIPLALILGYSLATPLDFSTLGIVGSILALLCLPLILRWHHFLLFLSWNLGALVFFLPGRPEFWIFMSLLSLTITLGQRAISTSLEMVPPPMVLWPLLFLLAVVVATAKLTGGIGLGSLGGGLAGGRHYLLIICAILGFVAMTTHQIPKSKVYVYSGAYLLGGMTTLIGLMVPLLGSSGAVLFAIFPVDMATYESQIQSNSLTDHIGRYYAVSAGLNCMFYYLLARYGVRNLLTGRNWLRLLVATACFGGGLMGGFRTFLIGAILTVFFIFWLDGMLRSRYVIIPILALTCCLLALPFARNLPISIQRSISFLPVDVDPMARMAAESTTTWRIELWKLLLPDIPKYFWLGKGLGIKVSEMDQGVDLAMGGETRDPYSSFILTGDYHNGPLSVIIPFGIWGMIGWIWFIAGAGRALYLNYRYGDIELRIINTYIFATFCSSTVVFFTIFGGFYGGLAGFTGLVGLSISLNGGIKRAAKTNESALTKNERVRKFARFQPLLVDHSKLQ